MSIKECIITMPGRKLVEADYSQLEIRVLACLSQDKKLVQDLQDGLDMHCMSAALMLGKDYSTIKAAVDAGEEWAVKARKSAKSVSFLVTYGGGAKLASEQTGVPIHQVQAYIRNYNSRYPMVNEYHDLVLREAAASRKGTKKTTPKGNPAGVGVYTAPTGREFGFLEQDSPDWVLSATSFSPTQIKNYPTQGTGYDIVSAAIATIEEEVYHREYDAWFVNTVHDSILWEVQEDTVDRFISLVRDEMTDVKGMMKDLYNWDIPDVEFPVDITVGDNWQDMETV